MIDGGAEEVFSGRRRRGCQRIVRSVGTSFAGKVNGHSRAGGGVLSVIGPGIGRGLMGNFSGLQGDRRGPRGGQALRPFLAAAGGPVWIVSGGKDENGIL